MKYVFIHTDFYPLPIADHLQNEGHEVIVGTVHNLKDLRLPEPPSKEKPEEREQRLSLYSGILDKQPFQKVLNQLAKVKISEKEDYFFFFDFNNMFKISEYVLGMGFRKGLFPTKYYYQMEKDRKASKAFVKKHYPDLKVAEAIEFKDPQKGIEHINQSDEVYVLKSNGNRGKTIVPPDDLKIAKTMLCDALEEYDKEYRSQGFLLEKKIINCLEITPVIVFWNGNPVYSLVEFENKEFGAGNIGVLKGGNQALNIRTKLDCPINKIAFPPIIYQLAQKQPGLSIFDAGLLYDGKGFDYTEHCAMRYGYDGAFSEFVMRDEGEPFVGAYFEDIMAGKNPLKKKYGVYVRLFHIAGDYEITEKAKDDAPVYYYKTAEKNLFLYNIKTLKNKIVSVGGSDILGVATGSSDTLESAVNKTYAVIDKVFMEKIYFRPKFDFLSKDYPTSIMNRVEALKEFI